MAFFILGTSLPLQIRNAFLHQHQNNFLTGYAFFCQVS